MKLRKNLPVLVATLAAQAAGTTYSDWIDTLSFDAVIVHVNLTISGGGGTLALQYQGSPLAAPTGAAGDGGPMSDIAGTAFAMAATSAVARVVIPIGAPIPRKFRLAMIVAVGTISATIHVEMVKQGGLE